MRWEDETETADQKFERLAEVLRVAEGKGCVVVAESAGGSMGIRLAAAFPDAVETLITVCGKNRGSAAITDPYRRRYAALVQSVQVAEEAFATISGTKRKNIYCLYSSGDTLLGSHDTTLPGCHNKTISSRGHGRTIWELLLLQNSAVFRKLLSARA